MIFDEIIEMWKKQGYSKSFIKLMLTAWDKEKKE